MQIKDPKTFVESIIAINIDQLQKVTKIRLRGFIEDELFSSEAVSKSSAAAAGVCAWVLAVNDYCQITKNIRITRFHMEESEDKFTYLSSSLHEKVNQYYTLVESIVKLESESNLNGHDSNGLLRLKIN